MDWTAGWERCPGGRRKLQAAPVFLPGKSHGQRSLAGYNPWGHEEVDTTSDWTHAHTHTHILNNQVTRGVDTVSTLCSHSHLFASLSSLFQKLSENSKCMHACAVASVVSDSVRSHGLQPARLFCPWNSPGKNTGVGCCAVLQGSVKYINTNVINTPHIVLYCIYCHESNFCLFKASLGVDEWF